MKRKPALALALVLVCVIAAVFLLAPGPAGFTRQKIQLPDGNIATLEKVTFSLGSQHDFSFDDSALSRFGRKLPRFLRRYFPTPPRMSWNTSSNSLVLWLTLWDSKTGAPLDFHKVLAVEIADEHGCSSSAFAYGSMSSGSGPIIYVDTFTQFPRRQKTFRVRLRYRSLADGDSNKPAAEFELPNPMRGPFPVWSPEQLPAAHTNADLVFILKDTGNPTEGPAWRSLQFDILRGGLPTSDWERDEIYVAEATGNRGQRPFCTNESAWKLEVQFVRNVKAEFLPSEMFTITNLSVPASGAAVQLTNTLSLQGEPFALCAIAGPGHFVYSNAVLTIAEPLPADGGKPDYVWSAFQGPTPIHTLDVCRTEPHVAVALPPFAAEERLLLRAHGHDGVAHKLVSCGSTFGLGLFTLSSITNAASFDLDVILQRVRGAEFIVKPPGKQ